MQTIIRLIFHLTPLLPLILGRYYLGIATLLLVALFYIKSFKLKQQIFNLDARPELSPAGSNEREQLLKLLHRWQWLTFLR